LLKGIGAGCDEAAMAAVRKVRFTPGKQRGLPVKVKVSVPVLFRIRAAS
jgi:protein TonB